jgi:hypothetical protein
MSQIKIKRILFYYTISHGDLGIGDWGLGIGDWAQSPIPNPQSPIPNPQQKDLENKKIILDNNRN